MPRLSRPAAFWSTAGLLILLLAASGVPSPLYRVYPARFGFGSGLLTTVFGIYALALLAALLVVGGLSDHVGRARCSWRHCCSRPWRWRCSSPRDSVGWLLAARIVQGLSTGALTGTFGAALMDSQRRERPLGPLVNSAAPGLGLSLGAAVVGLLVEFVPSPTDWVFGVLTASSWSRRGRRPCCRRARRGCPARWPRCGPGARAGRPARRLPRRRPLHGRVWALGGLYASLGPSLVAGVFGVQDHLVGSLLILALTAPARSARWPLAGRPRPRRW